MARTARVVVPNVVHHVVARGVERRNIFTGGFDKARYLKRFAKIAAEEQVQVHGYCLMSNHVHWILTPTTANGLARLFARVHTWWAMRYNLKTNRSGHLFQSRYHSSPLGESHYWTALRYVELNPGRAGLVAKPEHWTWSSARAHLHGQPDRMIHLVPVITRQHYSPEEWREFLTGSDPEHEQALRRAHSCSRPCGTAEWIQELENHVGRKLAWSRPKRAPDTSGASFAA